MEGMTKGGDHPSAIEAADWSWNRMRDSEWNGWSRGHETQQI